MNKKNKTSEQIIKNIFFLFLLLFLVMPVTASAYIDPGSGSFLIQMLIAGILGVIVSARSFLRQLFIRPLHWVLNHLKNNKH